jgi:hypothetical protein
MGIVDQDSLCSTQTLTTNKCTKRVLSSIVTVLQAGTADSSRLQKQRSTQSTAHSHSTIKCNLSVMVTKKALPEDGPAGSKHVGVCYD